MMLQVAVEAFGGELDFRLLSGLWRLLYTTASDVVRYFASPWKSGFRKRPRTTSCHAAQLPLVATSAPGLLPLRVSNVYQQFSSPEEGSVLNIIDLSLWPLLQVLTLGWSAMSRQSCCCYWFAMSCGRYL